MLSGIDEQAASIGSFERACNHTWISGGDEELRCVFGILGEAGEIAELYKKAQRKGEKPNAIQVMDEMGDVLYYITMLAHQYGKSLEDIMTMNIAKLSERELKGTLHASKEERAEK